jgi:hypothetical protein
MGLLRSDVAGSFAALRNFARKPAPEAHCEMCSLAVGPEHHHLVEPKSSKLMCVCGACAVLFSGEGNLKYKRVPRRILRMPGFQLTDAQWDSLLIPINMAFFLDSSIQRRVAVLYPSPAGATESQLPVGIWNEIVAENPPLQQMSSDVEALLVNRLGPSRGFADPVYYILPIDECYRLVGLIRTHWHGLSGGEVWRHIETFFADLKLRAEGPNA